VDLLLSDLEAVAELLKEQYHQEQIFIAGHSWGSYLALRYAAAHPENVRYYIGTGQEISAIASGPDKYRFVKEQALKRNDKTVLRKLERFGEPDGNKYQTKDKQAGNYIWKKIFGYSGYFSISGPSLPKYLTRYLRLYVRYYGLSTGKVLVGGIRSVLLLNAEMDLKDSLSGVTEVPFPVLLISGEEDMICPVPTARRWFDRLTAPKKEYVIIKNASHMVNFERPEEWNRLVLSLLRQEKKKAKHRGK
jgi:pimeloyl-ACP methyl ester carboxylesterase